MTLDKSSKKFKSTANASYVPEDDDIEDSNGNELSCYKFSFNYNFAKFLSQMLCLRRQVEK